MKRMLKISMAIAALALLANTGLVRDAEAEVRVGAVLRTPNVSIRIGNVPAGPYGRVRIGHLPARPRRHYTIIKRDRQIAHRLAWYTNVPARKLIRLRTFGYDWYEIGRWLRLPRRVVRAAFDKRSWKRFTHGGHRVAGHGEGRYGNPEVVVYDY